METKEAPVPYLAPSLVLMGRLDSNLDYPVVVVYGDSKIRVSPRAQLPNVDKHKLGPLPKGLVFVG